MSQRSPSNTFCNENKDKIIIFDNLFMKFSEEIDYHVKTKIMNSLVQTYLQSFKEELETNIRAEEFLKLVSQIPLLCSKFLQPSSVKPNFLNETESTETLENKNENLESASLCFDAIITCLEAFCVTKQGLIMIKISLNILSQGYTHCKESEVIYGDDLEQFANQLGGFFKKIENVQMVVLEQLDKLDVKSYPDDDLHINCIVFEMGALCEIVFSLDADIAFELWPKYIRIITDHKSLKHITNIAAVSVYLATKNIEVLELIKCSLSENSEGV